MEIEKVKIAELKPAGYNPRQISEKDFEQLKKSLAEFEAVEPAVVNKHKGRENIIIGGHQRIKAAKALCWETYPCYFVDLPEEKERELNIRLNRGGEWDFDKLANEFDLEFLTEVGFDERELGIDFGTTDDDDEFVADDDLPDGYNDLTDEQKQELEEQADSKPGRVYQLGDHILVCGDSTDTEIIDKATRGIKIDMVMTDPPYGVSYDDKNEALDKWDGGNRNKTVGIKNDGADDFVEVVEKALKNVEERSKQGAVWYVFAPSAGKPAFEFYRILLELNILRHTLVWVKDSFVIGRTDYHYQHEAIMEGYTSSEETEYIQYGWKDGAQHVTPPDRKRTTVIIHSRPKKSTIHPTMKPVNLVSMLIKNGSERGDLVFDPFMGSGSTLIAAAMTGRKAAGVEYSPVYCDAIRRRWTRYAKENGLEVGSGGLFI